MSTTEETPALSVILPCLNGAETIAVQLEALARQKWSQPWEVIVADNGSTDDSMAIVEQFRDRLPGLRIVDASGGRGQAFALNRGIREARAPAVVLCDADDEVGDGWLGAMGKALARHEVVACRGDSERLNESWIRETRQMDSTGLSKLWFPPYLPFAASSALGVRRAVHESLGGFDESLLRLFDVEYCVRLAQRGHELVFVPEAVLHYRFRHRWRDIFRQSREYAEYGASLQRRLKPPDARFPGRTRWLGSGARPLLRTFREVGSRAGRAKLAWLLGWQVGRFWGSVRYRVLAV